VPSATVAVRLTDPGRIPEAALLLERAMLVRAVRPQRDRLEIEVAGSTALPVLVRLLEEHEIPVHELSLSKPSLDEVFFRHTGRKIRDARESPPSRTGVPGHR
jgi:hypothetical protein